jgi:undecaprenyl-diphosphatase
LGIADSHALAFDTMLHLATVGAVITYFRRDMSALVQTFLRYVGRMPVGEHDVTLLFAIIAGTIPAAIAGFFLERTLDTAFRSPLIVALVLVFGSGLLGVADYVYKRRSTPLKKTTIRTGILVGLFQTLALMPGMSRSGSTISGGMLLGLSRREATRFAFLLSIPVILGAGLKKTLEMLSYGGDVSWGAVFVGAFVAFIVGLFAIHFMIGYVRNHTFKAFIWYRVALGLVVILMVFAG